jgi:bacterial/archaeal transporter family-2 protein
VSKEIAVVVTVAAGSMVAAQAPINNMVSQKVGSFGAVTVNFVVGTILILIITLVFAGGFKSEAGADPLPWYAWIFGGLAGVAIVGTTLVTVRELGAGGVTAATIAGQLTLSVVLDKLGVLGLEERAVTWDKLLGIALLAAGTILIARE